jgi:hypothetical protein
MDQACKLGMDALRILHDVEYATGVQRCATFAPGCGRTAADRG